MLDDKIKPDNWIYTRKKNVLKAKGCRCFLIVGKTENKIKNYYLWASFIIEDFVFEFDYIDKIDYDLIDTLYFKLLEGYDIVSAAPKKTEKLTSKMFYKVFNASIKNGNELKTETFRILSRKAINRIHSMNKTIL